MRMPRMSLVVVSLLVLSSCATVRHGRYQYFPVNSSPAGANVTVDCNGHVKEAGMTPVVVKLKRKADHCSITVMKDGYEPTSIAFTRTWSGWIWSNLLMGSYALPSALIDYVDGAAFNQSATPVPVTLLPKADSKSASAR